MSIALQGELKDAAEQVSADPDILAAVIYGGEKVFAAGADLKEMAGRNYAEMAAINGGHAALVEVLERRHVRVPVEPGADHPADVTPFLYGGLGHAGQLVQRHAAALAEVIRGVFRDATGSA